ncbi:acyl-CoA dehydrogenase family protein [Microbacterium sp. YY-03]|uniref:acyl-CoA dehydrogenase family protein n=1 Tax=Microbacterium sp. YY-03 TaxID=3421636 RepID=UPI003D174AD5
MDHLIDEDLNELRQLACMIMKSATTPARLVTLESRGQSHDDALWAELAQSGVTSVALPAEVGGMGFDLTAIAVVLREQGYHVAPLPLWTSMIAHRRLAENDLDTFMTLLEGAATGEVRTTIALEERAGADLFTPTVTAVAEGDGWVLNGTKIAVPYSDTATHVLVSAATPNGARVFLIDAAADGVTWTHSAVTSRGKIGRLELASVAGVAIGADAELAALVRESRIALAAVLVGIARGALKLTSGYVSEREQFGRPIGSFQSLQHQLADSSIAIDAAELVLAQALTEPENESAALVASWWGRTSAEDTVYRCQHVHGGIGVDVDYPIHRFFLWGRQFALTLGNVETDLEALSGVLIPGEVAA